jgi:GT2 family glycosyltransferase
MSNTMISIIIVNYNWKKRLKKCFDSLKVQTYQDFEIIMVDNASTDDSVIFTEKHYPEIKIIKSEKNVWFAWGNNLWLKHTSWDKIMLLNNDTWMESNFLEIFVREYNHWDRDILWVTEKNYDGKPNKNIYPQIDMFWHPIYFQKSNTKIITELFYTSWVCLLFSKKVYDDSWWLDNDFFMYFEETDRIRRCRIYGYNVWQLSDLYIYHAGAGTTGLGIKHQNFLRRNQNTLQILLKNYSWGTLLLILPMYFLINICELLLFFCIGKWQISLTYLQWRYYNIKIINKTLKKRQYIQNRRLISDYQIMKFMYKGFAKLHHLFYFIIN